MILVEEHNGNVDDLNSELSDFRRSLELSQCDIVDFKKS